MPMWSTKAKEKYFLCALMPKWYYNIYRKQSAGILFDEITDNIFYCLLLNAFLLRLEFIIYLIFSFKY